MKVVAIVGMSSCGSTALSYALGCLPKVLSVGELHWACDRKFGEVPQAQCGRHGTECERITEELHTKLTYENAYSVIAERYMPDVLVTADKAMGHIVRYERLPDFAILLTRETFSHIQSQVPGYGAEAREVWIRSYQLAVQQLLEHDIPFCHVHADTFFSIATSEFPEDHKQFDWLSEATGGILPAGRNHLLRIKGCQWGGSRKVHESERFDARALCRARDEATDPQREAMRQSIESTWSWLVNLPVKHLNWV